MALQKVPVTKEVNVHVISVSPVHHARLNVQIVALHMVDVIEIWLPTPKHHIIVFVKVHGQEKHVIKQAIQMLYVHILCLH